MSAVILDAGAFVAVERGERAMAARLRAAQSAGLDLRTTGAVVAQVWRDPAGTGRQANLARLLRAVHVRPVDDTLGRQAGVLLGRAAAGDAIDATVVATCEPGDRILTSEPGDLSALARASGRSIMVIPV